MKNKIYLDNGKLGVLFVLVLFGMIGISNAFLKKVEVPLELPVGFNISEELKTLREITGDLGKLKNPDEARVIAMVTLETDYKQFEITPTDALELVLLSAIAELKENGCKVVFVQHQGWRLPHSRSKPYAIVKGG